MNTIFLATVMGWFLVIVSLFILIKFEQVQLILTNVLSQRGLFFVVAIFTLILGLLMVVSHNLWVMGWPVVVTILSWLVLISGLIRLFCFDYMYKMANLFLAHPHNMRIASIIFLVVGLFLLYHVYYFRVVA